MAKKTTAQAKPELAPGDVEILEAEVIETPRELMLIKQEYGLKLSDDKVDRHIKTYAPFFKELVDLETELSALLVKEPTPETEAEAKALRKKYSTIRLSSQKQKGVDKEFINAEGKFLDTVDNRIKAAASEKEAKCAEIETKLKTLENERKTRLKNERRDLLEAQGYETDFLTLEDMTEEGFNKLLDKAKTIKKGLEAQEKLDAAEKEKEDLAANMVATRIKLLNSIGIVLDEQIGVYDGLDGSIGVDAVKTSTDEEFNGFIKGAEEFRADRLADIEAGRLAEKERQDRITKRMNMASGLGLAYEPSTGNYTGYGQTITLAQIKEDSDEVFTASFNTAETLIIAKKEEEKKESDALAKKTADALAENKRLKKVESDRLAKEKADREAKEATERAALLAPDKEKFKAFYVMLKGLKAPEFKTPAAIKAGAVITKGLNTVLESAKREAVNLV